MPAEPQSMTVRERRILFALGIILILSIALLMAEMTWPELMPWF
jgi:type II secretory pathway component PulM